MEKEASSPEDVVDEQAGVHIENDLLGSAASILVDTSVYAETDVFKAAYWYTDRYYLFLSRNLKEAKYIRIEIRQKKESDSCHLDAACREFCNALIDYRVRRIILSETRDIRDALLRKAFGEGRNHLDPEKLGLDESHIPDPEQNFLEDKLNIGHPTGAG